MNINTVVKANLVNVNSAVDFQRRWVKKSKIFGQALTKSKTTNVFCKFMNDSLSKSAKIVLSKKIFYTVIKFLVMLGVK
jgi:hypothetical protein